MQRPNTLLLFSDRHRWDCIGANGAVPVVRTPNTDGIASRRILFTQRRSISLMCAPALACLATELRYDR